MQGDLECSKLFSVRKIFLILISNINLHTYLIARSVKLFKIITFLYLQQMTIKVYGANWCSDCVVAKKFLIVKNKSMII